MITDLAAAAKEHGVLPKLMRVPPSIWACLAMDYYVPTCKCANCTKDQAPMIIGGVLVEIDTSVPDGSISYDTPGMATLTAEGYGFQSGI